MVDIRGGKRYHNCYMSGEATPLPLSKLNSLIKSDRGDRPCEVRQPAKSEALCKVPNPATKAER